MPDHQRISVGNFHVTVLNVCKVEKVDSRVSYQQYINFCKIACMFLIIAEYKNLRNSPISVFLMLGSIWSVMRIAFSCLANERPSSLKVFLESEMDSMRKTATQRSSVIGTLSVLVEREKEGERRFNDKPES